MSLVDRDHRQGLANSDANDAGIRMFREVASWRVALNKARNLISGERRVEEKIFELNVSVDVSSRMSVNQPTEHVQKDAFHKRKGNRLASGKMAVDKPLDIATVHGYDSARVFLWSAVRTGQ